MSSPPKLDEDNVAQSATPEEGDQVPTGQQEGDQGTGDTMEDSHDIDVKEQDRWLPIANVARIMKGALPENAKIAKEAKECMQECVSEFISFITSEASEKCQQEKRKTVNGEDILFAMTSLGFENYSEALKIYLARYRETFIASQGKAGGAAAGGAAQNPAGAAGPTGAYEGGAGGEMINPALDEHEAGFGNYDHNGSGETF